MGFIIWFCCILYYLDVLYGQSSRIKRYRNKKANISEAMLQEQKWFLEKMYFPNYGYEPYWEETHKLTTTTLKPMPFKERPGYGHYGGFAVSSTTPSGPRTTRTYMACGLECNYIYVRMGEICVHSLTDHAVEELCGVADRKVDCVAAWDPQMVGFITMKNYCVYMDLQCSFIKKFEGRYALLHMGPCVPMSPYYLPEFFNHSTVLKRKEKYEKDAEGLIKGWRGRWQEEYDSVAPVAT